MVQSKGKSISVISTLATGSASNINLPGMSQRKMQPRKYNLTNCFVIIYLFSRAIGLLPFSVVRDSNGRVQRAKVSLLDFIWFAISIGLNLFMAFYCYQTTEVPQDPNESVILIIGDNMLLIVGLLLGAFSILIDMFNRGRLVNIVKRFSAFDDEVNIFHMI